MLHFEFNLSRIKKPGYGRLARVPQVKQAATVLASLPTGTVVNLTDRATSPLASFPALAKRLRQVGITKFVVNTDTIGVIDKPKALETALKLVVRRPLEYIYGKELTYECESALESDRLRGKTYYREEKLNSFSLSADAGDIPAVHLAVKKGRVGLLEIDDVWRLANQFLTAEELVRIAAICRGTGITKVMSHPAFPADQAPTLIVDYLVRLMRTPDLLSFNHKRLEHHIDEIGTGDFYTCETEEMSQMFLLFRGAWWYFFFCGGELPESRWSYGVRCVRNGLLARDSNSREQIMANLDSFSPKLAWLLRETMQAGFDDNSDR